jgi:hypothetical protein
MSPYINNNHYSMGTSAPADTPAMRITAEYGCEIANHTGARPYQATSNLCNSYFTSNN